MPRFAINNLDLISVAILNFKSISALYNKEYLQSVMSGVPRFRRTGDLFYDHSPFMKVTPLEHQTLPTLTLKVTTPYLCAGDSTMSKRNILPIMHGHPVSVPSANLPVMESCFQPRQLTQIALLKLWSFIIDESVK